MERTDRALIGHLSTGHPELRRLWEEHQALEQRLDALGRHAYLTADETVEQRTLKKRKLAGRDRMERILAGHR